MIKEPGEPRFLAAACQGITHLAEGGTHLDVTVAASGYEPEEVREIMADVHGVETDNVTIVSKDGEPYDRDRPAQRAGRMSVAFSSERWRASWDPHADPTMN